MKIKIRKKFFSELVYHIYVCDKKIYLNINEAIFFLQFLLV